MSFEGSFYKSEVFSASTAQFSFNLTFKAAGGADPHRR